MRIASKLRMAPKRVSAIIAIAAAVVTVPAALLAWGPSRDIYTIEKPADHVTFNSITNNPNIGDERNFVGIREVGSSNVWYDNVNVQKGKEYYVRVYVHNNAASNLNASGKGIAKDVLAKINLPTSTGKSIQVDGQISATNATPKAVWDQANFTSSENFNLAYVKGTMKYENNKGTFTLPESILTNTGAKLGYDKMDGTIPGCFQYAGYISFKVKPQFAETPDFTVVKDVRKDGTSTYGQTAAVNPGDKVNYRITFKNTSPSTTLKKVVLQDKLPTGMTYVAGTAKLQNSNYQYPNMYSMPDEMFTNGAYIGDYAPNGNAFITFTAKVADKSKLACGPQTLTNTATVETDFGSKKDTADVTVTGNECKPEVKKIEVCELATKKIITIDETAFDASKHSKNLDDCKEVVRTIEVCELDTKKIVTIDEKDFDSSKYSKNLADCEEKPVTKKIKVCELETKKIVTIDEDMFDAKKHSKDLADCEEVPVTPPELPHTGPAEVVAKLAGAVSLAGASAYYIASRRSN